MDAFGNNGGRFLGKNRWLFKRICGKIYTIRSSGNGGEIDGCIEKAGNAYDVYAAPFAVFLNNDDINYVEPDLSVICDLSKLDDKGCHGAPDWVIEIVSSGSRSRDYMTKLFKYRTAGVREYWIVDPDKQMIMVYGFEKDMVEKYDFNEAVPVGIYEGFTVKIE